MSAKLKKRIRIVHQAQNPYEGRLGLAYIRVSDKSQELNGSGQSSQETRCKIRLAELGIPYERSFIDTYTGGGDFMRRPSMRELLKHVRTNRGEKFVVVFDDLKRFARDLKFHLALREAFDECDVIPLCLNFNFEDSPSGRFVERVLAAQAELDREQNAEQVVNKMEARLLAGYWPFSKKRGYDMIRIPGHGKVAQINKLGYEVIKPALEGFASGNLPRKMDVARFMVERGMWEGKEPVRCLDHVSGMLEDPFYAGFIEYEPWGVSRRKGEHKGLIEPDTFLRIQARLGKAEAVAKPRKDTSDEYPLRGLLTCELCGGHLSASASTSESKKKYGYYFCQNRKCERYFKTLRKKDVEDDFKELLSRNRLKPEVAGVAAVVFDKVWGQETEAVKWQDYLHEQRKTDLTKKIKDLSEMVRKAKSEKVAAIYEAQIEDTARELEKMEGTALMGKDLGVPYRTALDKSMGMLKSPVSTWDLFDVHEQHRLFFFLFEAKLAYVKNEGYRTGDSLSKTRLFEELAATNSNDVDPRRFELLTPSLQMRCSTN